MLAQENTAKADLWIQDFAKAKAQAKAEKKDLLIDFTGSDWCSWCQKLESEVFSQAAFLDAAPKSFVLVRLDFPQDETRVTAEIKAQNEKLQKEYSIRGYPTILLADAEGKVYGQTGYEQGGPESYNTMLADMKKKGEVFQAAMVLANAKKGAERAQALDTALSALAEEVVDSYHLEVMKEILAADEDGKLKLKDKYGPRVQKLEESILINTEATALQEMISPLMQAGEGDQALAKLDEVIKAPKNKIQHQLALFFKGMVTMDTSGDAKAALAALEAAKAIAPESPIAKRIDEVVPKIKEQAAGGK